MPVGWAVAIVVLWLAVIALAVVLLGVLRQITSHLDRFARQPSAPMSAQGPAVGSSLPDFTARDSHGGTVTAGQLRGEPSVLLFLSSGCAPCRVLAEEIAGSDPSDPGELTRILIVVTDPSSVDALRLPVWLRILTLPESTQAEEFGIPGRPFAIAADQDGFIRGTRLLNTVGHLTDFVASKLSPENASANGREHVAG